MKPSKKSSYGKTWSDKDMRIVGMKSRLAGIDYGIAQLQERLMDNQNYLHRIRSCGLKERLKSAIGEVCYVMDNIYKLQEERVKTASLLEDLIKGK